MTRLQLHRSAWLHLKNVVLSEKRKVTAREKKSKHGFFHEKVKNRQNRVYFV